LSDANNLFFKMVEKFQTSLLLSLLRQRRKQASMNFFRIHIGGPVITTAAAVVVVGNSSSTMTTTTVSSGIVVACRIGVA
jgi:putative AlgH/UPF0301 family transcriptional regulator